MQMKALIASCKMKGFLKEKLEGPLIQSVTVASFHNIVSYTQELQRSLFRTNIKNIHAGKALLAMRPRG
jgi:hypothetical protein